MKTPNRPTLSDVARLAGVSIATASRALSNPDLVAEDKREAVRRAAQDCGYKINQLARSLRTRRSDTVLVLIPDLKNRFFPEIIMALEETARRAELSIILGLTYNHIDREDSYLELIRNQRADGLILLDGGIDKLLAAGIRPGVPTVQVLERDDAAALPSVYVNDRKIAELAVRHLAELGHRRIAHIAGRSNSGVAAERVAGFRETMARAGLEVDGSLIVHGDFHHDGGFAAMQQLFDVAGQSSAVFCANDESALGAMRACRTNGRNVPDEISIVGVDDIAEAALGEPPLTTVRQPRHDIGVRAMQLLLGLLRSATDLETQVMLPTELVIRESTAPPQA